MEGGVGAPHYHNLGRVFKEIVEGDSGAVHPHRQHRCKAQPIAWGVCKEIVVGVME